MDEIIKCVKCEAEKPPCDYYKNSKKCKECVKAAVRQNYADKREQYVEYERKRAQDPERKAKALVYQQTRRKKHPEKNYARAAVRRAVKSGLLIKPSRCTSCNLEVELEAHHHDYSKPLDIQWLCFACHRIYGHGHVVSKKNE